MLLCAMAIYQFTDCTSIQEEDRKRQDIWGTVERFIGSLLSSYNFALQSKDKKVTSEELQIKSSLDVTITSLLQTLSHMNKVVKSF